MQLTRQTDYAIRALVYTAYHQDRLVNITEIAEYFKISRSHLAKIVATLSERGFLKSIRGKGGGLKLGKPPVDINLGEVVRTFETFDLVACTANPLKENNDLTKHCGFNPILVSAMQAFLAVLDRYTLADIASTQDAKPTIDMSLIKAL